MTRTPPNQPVRPPPEFLRMAANVQFCSFGWGDNSDYSANDGEAGIYARGRQY